MNKNWVAILLIAFALIDESEKRVPEYDLSIINEPSALGTKEDPFARANFELNLLADPSTGQLPLQIREKELAFSSHIPSKVAYATANNLRVTQLDYRAAGPNNVGGRTRAAAVDIRNENILISGGVSGSMWKSTNQGLTWKKTSNANHRRSVTSLAQDTRPGFEDIWYHGTGELIGNSARSLAAPYRGVGIYKSSDNGESWQLINGTAAQAPQNFYHQLQYVWRIQTNHTNLFEDEVLVAVFGGILRSVNGGRSWGVVLGSNLLNLPVETDLNCTPAPFFTELQKTSDGTFFAALSSSTSTHRNNCENEVLAPSAGFYTSTNGTNWSEITSPGFPEYHERTVIGFSASEELVYFYTHTSSDSPQLLWRFDYQRYQSGQPLSQCWLDLSGNLPAFGGEYGDLDSQGGYNMLIQGHPSEENVTYIGGTNLYRSSTGFSTNNATDWIGGYQNSNNSTVYPNHYADQHLLIFFPSESRKMLSAHDGGLSITNQNLMESVTWSSLNTGYITSQFYTIAQQQDQPTDAIIGGMQDNGTYLRSGADIESPDWRRVLGGDGGFAAIAPNKDLYYTSFQEGQVYRLSLNDDSGLTSFARVDPVGAGDDTELLFINPYILDPLNASRMYFTGGDVLWRNENLLQIPGGSQNPTSVNWTKISKTRLNTGIYTAIGKSSAGDSLIAGTYGERPRVVVVPNASHVNAEGASKFPVIFPKFGHIACIATNPENALHYLVIFSNYSVPSVFMTTDGGDNFTDISGNLEENPNGSGSGPSVRWAEIIPTTDGISYFVGTSTGLYSTDLTDGRNTTWVQESEEIIGNAIITMINYRAIDGRLIVATHGNGTFRTYIQNYRPLLNQSTPNATVSLSPGYPNPFTEKTFIEYSIPEDGDVKIDLYNGSGQLIKNLIWGPQFAGTSRILWDGTNTTGVQVQSGVYYYVMQYGKHSIAKRLIYTP